MRRLLLSVLLLIVLGTYINRSYSLEKEEDIRADIVFDYLKLNRQLIDYLSTGQEMTEDEFINHYLYWAVQIREENQEIQKKYSQYQNIKIAEGVRLGDFLNSINEMVVYYLTGIEKAREIKMNDAVFLDNALNAIHCVSDGIKGSGARLVITEEQRQKLSEYIKDNFKTEIETYENTEKKPTYIWGIMLIRGILEGEQAL